MRITGLSVAVFYLSRNVLNVLCVFQITTCTGEKSVPIRNDDITVFSLKNHILHLVNDQDQDINCYTD